MCSQIIKRWIPRVLFCFSTVSLLISCRGKSGQNGQSGGNATLIGGLVATCNASAITTPSFVPSVLAANNIASLQCLLGLNDATGWLDGYLWECTTETQDSDVYNSSATNFNWPADGNTLPAPNSSGVTPTLGQAFYCAVACIAQYTDGTSSYILLEATGICQ